MNAPFIKEPVKTALSKQQDAKLAAQELADQLMGPDLGFVLFFCSAEYDLETLSRELHLAFDGVELAGCTTAGEVTPRGYDRGSITAVGFDQNLFSIDVALIESLEGFSLNDAQNLVSGLVTQSRSRQVAPIKGHSFALTLLDGLSSQEELVLMTLNSALGSIPSFGGSAGDDNHLTNTHVYHKGRFYTQAAIVVLISTPLDFEVFTTHHMTSLEEKLVVTAADPATRTVFELNAIPAAEEYARVVGVPLDALDHKVFALNPVAVRIGQEYYVRSIQRVNEDGSLTFYCAVENGIVLTAMQPGSMIEDLNSVFTRLETEVGPPLITLGCDCFLRRLELEHREQDQRMSEFLQQHRVIGFNTYGEQYDGMHINQTFTGVVIGKRNRDG
ncbi:nitric oxide-sensing protein NosP [Marinobacterium litorale]|uniref:nitric oxide-sensing protein NosP n=1 Tax=Marinobacterium litorale TaxID=404770 RepID=UPI0004002C71|nr:nitric oxide-sensing protein NosP [Marinobacterium litorale]